MKKQFWVIFLFFCVNRALSFGSHTFFRIRPQSVNAVRDLVGTQRLFPLLNPPTCCYLESDVCGKKNKKRPVQRWSEESHNNDKNGSSAVGCGGYTVFSTTLEYSRSFRSGAIREFLFGCDKCLVFSGSRVANRGQNDILADYFGLPADFKSVVTFDPVISNVVLDFNALWSFDDWVPGLYLRMHMPVIHSKWDLDLCESEHDKGEAFHPAGYMGTVRLERSRLAQNVEQAFRGELKFGDMRDSLRFGKICGSQSKTSAGELYAIFGWNYVCRDWWHAGINMRTGFKTCASPTSEFLFEPVLGNGGHWVFGVGFTGHVDMWQRGDHKLALHSDLNIEHLFSSEQRRSYDLKNNGNGSRYMLVQHFDSPSYDLEIDGNAAQVQYQGCLSPAINHTTLKTDISIGAQIDWVLKLSHYYKKWEFDFGYNLYARSRETCNGRESFNGNCFALKGDAQLYGFEGGFKRVPLNATQSEATIKAGQGVGNSDFRNSNANTAGLAQDVSGPNLLSQLLAADSVDLGIAINQVNGSITPVLLSDDDINVNTGLLPSAVSHKLFINASHLWDNTKCITPYIATGFSVEWADTKTCDNSAHSQWALWIKGGFTY